MAFNFNQFKDLFSTIKEKGAQVAGVAADKTKDAARIAKLTMDLNTEKGSLEKAFLELGKAYYEESKDSAQGLAAQLCAEISAINGRIESIQGELDGLKDSFKPAEEPDFEEVVSAEEPCECCEEGWAVPLVGGALGWIASDAGTGSFWYQNARECPLLPWRGDPLSVGGPERLWAEIDGRAVSFFASGSDGERVTFRFGQAVWEKTVNGVTLRLTAFLPPDRDVRVFLLESDRPVRVHWCAPLQMAPEPEDRICCYVNLSDDVLRASNPRCVFGGVTLTARCSEPWEELGSDEAAFAFGECVRRREKRSA